MLLWGAGAILLALVGGALAYWKLATPKRSLPVIAAKLPPQTISILEKRPGTDPLDDVARLPDIYVTSGLTALCAGTDVVNLIGLARGKDLAWLKKEGVLDLPQFRKGLQCADAIRQGLIDPEIAEVHFMDGDTVRLVTTARSRIMEPAPGLGYVRHSFSGLPGFCLHPPDTKDECPEDTNAAFRDGETWVWGRFSAVEPFARSYTTSRDELSTTVDILKDTIAASDLSDVTELMAKPERIDWGMPCSIAAPIGKGKEFMNVCFPKGQEKLLEGITSKVRGSAVGRDVVAKAEGIRFIYTLVARDPDAAHDIEKDLLDFARDWRAQLTNGEPDMAKLIRAKSVYVHDSFWASIYEPYLRALRSMSVSRNGAVVHLQIKDVFRHEEAKSLREFTSTQTLDRNAAGDIVAALLGGTTIPEKSLAVFVAPGVAKWINAPRATDADCNEITGKLKALVGAAAADASSTWTDQKKSCVGGVMPSEYRTCLMTAADLKAYGACYVTWSPFTAEATDKLQGQWEAANVEQIVGIDRQLKNLLANTKLEFMGNRVAASYGPYVSDGNAKIRGHSTGEVNIDLPMQDKSATVSVTWPDADTFKVKDWVPHVESVTFKRAKFDESLFTQAKAAAARKAPGYDSCLGECMKRGGLVAKCDKECIGQ